ncbi:DUF6088 family protein [Mesorhizobium sp. M0915]|uniref:DUF6088 family protein n=1 Tax=Mesorhizobium sp. M0915 TaxID=2957027 RepID=UPI0033377C14
MKRARAGGRGSVFTPSDFLDIAGRAAVDQALSRIKATGHAAELSASGHTTFPRCTQSLVRCHEIRTTWSRRSPVRPDDRCKLRERERRMPSACPYRVPAKSIYLTDGPSMWVVLGKRIVDLRHASPKHLIAPGSPAGAVVQALRHLGPARAIDIAQVAGWRLSAGDKKMLANSAVQAPAWMRSTLVSIAQGGLGWPMDKIAVLSRSDRSALFGQTSAAVRRSAIRLDRLVISSAKTSSSFSGQMLPLRLILIG